MFAAKPTPKAEETAQRILDASLDMFRAEGFDHATMRAIASRAGVATGAAYYYYPSKEAIVLAFYQRAWEQMQPALDAAARGKGLEARLRGLIGVKLDHFAPNREVLRALLRNGADPGYPLSPFSQQTSDIRAADIGWFRRILADCGVKLPSDLEPRLPEVLWFLQMGVIFFWVIDGSPDQRNSRRLLDLAAKSVVTLLRASSLPFLRPLRKTALELIELVAAD